MRPVTVALPDEAADVVEVLAFLHGQRRDTVARDLHAPSCTPSPPTRPYRRCCARGAATMLVAAAAS